MNDLTIDRSRSPARIDFGPGFNAAVPFIDRHLSEGRGGKVYLNGSRLDEPYVFPGNRPSDIPFKVTVPADTLWDEVPAVVPEDGGLPARSLFPWEAPHLPLSNPSLPARRSRCRVVRSSASRGTVAFPSRESRVLMYRLHFRHTPTRTGPSPAVKYDRASGSSLPQ